LPVRKGFKFYLFLGVKIQISLFFLKEGSRENMASAHVIDDIRGSAVIFQAEDV
jgi:hypothetical protein